MSGRFLERWSQLKRGGEPAPADAPESPAQLAAAPPQAAATAPANPTAPVADVSGSVLPPVDSLNLEADFTAFMKKEVSESLRRAALRKLFSDPHFHFERMDRLDIYIDDYSVSDPIPADMMQRLRQFDTLLRNEDDAAEAVQAAPPAAAAPDVALPSADGEAVAATPASGDASPTAAASAPDTLADGAEKTL